ncbi:grasp-with-spasm system SPASM domain peptide maturase [Chryseobacterium sp. SIMBA_038]|uniref:grasp-with-spasm system SPASM domain peptide maturase n=1 Tax=Chryseobacterium sp. SIMBA_038 TaxID=3085780 RepID=UPI003979B461
MFLKLFESVKITKGAKSSIIFDTNTGFLQLIPNALFDLLSNDQQDYSLLKKQLDNDSLEILEEYFDFILDNNLGFIVKSKKELFSFKASSNFYVTPSNVEYLILDINNLDILNDNLINEICNLKIKYLQIRFSEELISSTIIQAISIINRLNNSTVNEISIIAKYDFKLLSFIRENIYTISSKFLHFTFHSSNEEDFYSLNHINITTIKKYLKIPISCGLIDLKNVNLNRSFYLESQCHNSCLHKKISIDKDGNIKNCPSMSRSFGNIKNITLEEALNHQDFKKYWNLTKDKIEVCKDCEFRYVCTDCRAYTEQTHTNENGLDISKPLKCGYDPYTGEWEEWSTNPLKQKAIHFYGMQNLVKKY